MEGNGKPISVLHVDDNGDYLDLIGMRLPMEAPDFEIIKIRDVRAVQKTLKKVDVDCFLVDYNMPHINGLQLLKEIRGEGIEAPVIFLTGQGNEDVAAEALRFGADDYFTKDFTIAHFPRIVNSIRQNVSRYKHILSERQASNELAEREGKFRALIESLDDIILILDKEGRFVEYYETSHTSPLLFPPSAFIGKKYFEVLPVHVSVQIEKAIENLIQSGRTEKFEYDLEMDDKKYWFLARISQVHNSEGEYTGITIVLTDITEKIENERALEQSENLHRFLVEHSFDMVYRVDMETGKYDFVSPSVADHLGVSAERIMKTANYVLDLVCPEDRELVQKHVKKRLQHPGKEFTLKYRIITEDSRILCLEQRSKVVLVNGKPKFIIGVLRNITENNASR